FDELDQARLEEGEQEKLEAELSQLENAEEIKRGLLGASHLLSESEQSATFSLKDTLQQLQSVQRFMPSVAELTERLQSVWIEVKDIADEVNAKEQEVFMDEGRLVEVNERLSLLYSLQKKHRVGTVAELITLRDELGQKILVVANQGERLTALEQEVAKCLNLLKKAAIRLHEARQQAVGQVEKYVQTV